MNNKAQVNTLSASYYTKNDLPNFYYDETQPDIWLATKVNVDSPTLEGAITFSGVSSVTGLTKSHVGLANVDNTADTNKPLPNAATIALNAKAPLTNPNFNGTIYVYDIDQSVAPSARTSSFRNTTIYGSLRLSDASLIIRPTTSDITISQFELSCLDNLQGNIQTHIDKMTQIFLMSHLDLT